MADTNLKRPFKLKLVMSLAVFVTFILFLELAFRVVDSVIPFHHNLLKALEIIETSDTPTPPLECLPWFGESLLIRVDDVALPLQKHTIGSKSLEDVQLHPKTTYVTPEDLERYQHQIFVVGGSAAFGYPLPYTDTFAAHLDTAIADKGGQVINAAQLAWPSGKLVATVKRIVESYNPDTIIVYCGNNEWINWNLPNQPRMGASLLGFYRLLSKSYFVAALEYYAFKKALQHPDSGDTTQFTTHHELTGYEYALKHPAENYTEFDAHRWMETKRKFLANFKQNLTMMCRYCKLSNTRLILLTVPYNYKLSPVWKHPQPTAFKKEALEIIQAKTQEAIDKLEQGNFEEALTHVHAILEQDSKPPLPHYLKGWILEKLERYEDAEIAYAQCRENMIGNLGSVLSINTCIRKVAVENNVALIDIKTAFDEQCHARGEFFNEGMIVDDCHPSALGHKVIADKLTNTLY